MGRITDYGALAELIISLVGGESNIGGVTHCATRLRLNLIDESKADTDAIKNLDGVVDVISHAGQYQIIIGAEVTQVHLEVTKRLSSEPNQNATTGKKGALIDRFIDTVTGIFTPILPPLTAAGMLKAVLALLVAFKLVDSSSSTYSVINFMADATFYFLPIMLANSAAKKIQLRPLSCHHVGRHTRTSKLRKHGYRLSGKRYPHHCFRVANLQCNLLVFRNSNSSWRLLDVKNRASCH